MVITETGSLRIKGTINELNRDSIMEGTSVTIRSRTDSSVVWNGVVDSIDWDTQISDNNNYYYGSSDEMSTSSKYPFYVTLDSTEGLFLGQHVYIEPTVFSNSGGELWLPAYYINDADSSAWVWADNGRGKLEKRAVVLGEYDDETDEYVIQSGLTVDDSIAFPDDSFEAGMSVELVEDLSPDSSYSDDYYYGEDDYTYDDYSDDEDYSGDDSYSYDDDYVDDGISTFDAEG
jgi:HlyD family secretion protein